MTGKEIKFQSNTICYGDCLDILQKWVEQNKKVDLIYLDPPFNSSRNYNMIFRNQVIDERAQFVAFKDTWYWSATAHARVEQLCRVAEYNFGETMQGLKLILGESDMLAYVSYMAERLIWMHKILKDTGSIYLHCDPTANYYLRVVLDRIFGEENFRNEIAWCYASTSQAQRWYPKKHDTIFWYAKSLDWKFNADEVRVPFTKPLVKHGKTWKSGSKEVLEERTKVGKLVEDWWHDIFPVNSMANERLGYPTQKPRALLERILKASSNEGDLVLDPFCGCGTTAAASLQLKREFIGIDISPYAITRICNERLKNPAGVVMQGLPVDPASAEDLSKDPFVFEQWAVSCLPGFAPNAVQVGDGGIDGRGFLLLTPFDQHGKKLTNLCIAQVKVGKPSVDSIGALLSKVIGGGAAIRVFITLKKLNETPTMKKAIATAGTLTFANGTETYQRMVFWSIEEYFDKIFPTMPERGHPQTGKNMAQIEMENL